MACTPYLSHGMMRGAGLLIVVGALAAAGPAAAGTFTVYACKKPDGTPAATDGWAAGQVDVGGAVTTSECASGGPMRAELGSGAAHPKGTRADLVFTAPTGMPVVGYVVYRTVDVGPNDPSTYAYHYDLFEDNVAIAERCVVECKLGDPTRPLGEASAFVQSSTRTTQVTARASCSGDGDPQVTTCGTQARTSKVALHRVATVLEDTTDPELTSTPSGTLFDSSRAQSGVVSGSFSAKDTGSGVFQATIDVDGRAVATSTLDDNGGKCQVPFTARVPCKPQASGTASLDTTPLADGQHTVRLVISDATQTNDIAFGPVTITTRNAAPTRGTPNGANASDGALLTAFWRGTTTSTLRSAFRRRVVLTGFLKAPNGTPITSGLVDIFATNRSLGATEHRLGTVTTRSDGAWSYALRAGPGVNLVARYRAFSGDIGFAASRGALLIVRAAATLTLSRRSVRRGAAFTMTGKLRGGPVPRSGKDVVLQVFDGGRWRLVAVVRASRAGVFRHTFRFQRGGGRRHFRLRALVRADDAYPYAQGASPIRTVLVRP